MTNGQDQVAAEGDPRQSFIEEFPLYTRFECKNFYPPQSVSIGCAVCGKETTWQVTNISELYQATRDLSGQIATYQCVLCKKGALSVFIRIAEKSTESPYSTLKVQKIGQFPPQSVEIPRDIEKRLGSDSDLYRNALVCRNANFGIGALAYMRRVIEDKTNELIEVVAEHAVSYGVGSAEVSKIRAAKDERMSYDERLKLASEAIPASLKPDGANPLAGLYGLLSQGLHARSEEECVSTFDETRDVFEYVFARLRAEIEDRNRVVSKIKRWVGTAKTTVQPTDQ
jgi:hypothetical protein